MSKELIPEPRVNKLGHVVTKHVKADTPQSSLKVIPPVSGGKMRAEVMAERRAQSHADSVEFSQIKTLKGTAGFEQVRKDIGNGSIRLSDIKAIGASRLGTHNRLEEFADVLKKHRKGKLKRSIDDMKDFLDKAGRDHVVRGYFRNAIPLFEAKPMSEINKLNNLQSFLGRYMEFRHDAPDLVERAFQKALFIEGMKRGGVEGSGRYWSEVVPKEADVLWEAGVKAEDALPLTLKGLSAQQVIGVLSGVEPSIAEGWL
jgi:hypothetical protein